MKSISDPRYLEMIARLRSARETQGYSQKQLAEMVGKPQSFVAKVETCERRIDLIEALTLCSALKISLESLVPAELTRALFERERVS